MRPTSITSIGSTCTVAPAALVGVQVDPCDERRAGAGPEPDVRADQQLAAFVAERVVLLVARARELADALLVLRDAEPGRGLRQRHAHVAGLEALREAVELAQRLEHKPGA